MGIALFTAYLTLWPPTLFLTFRTLCTSDTTRIQAVARIADADSTALQHIAIVAK